MEALPIITRKEEEKIPESDLLYQAYLLPTKADLQEMGFSDELAEKVIYRVLGFRRKPYTHEITRLS